MAQERAFGGRGYDGLSFEPLAKDIEGYTLEKAKADLYAAFAVACLSIPQALAYSVVAGVPPAAGIISMVLGTMIAALLSSSSHLVIGPNNATSILVQAAAAELFQKVYGGANIDRVSVTIELITVLTLFIGVTQIIAALFKLGRLIQFVSQSVVVGYFLGTAFAITVGQLFPFFGITCPDTADSIIAKLQYLFTHIGELHIITLLVAVGSLVFLFLMRTIKNVPSSITMIIMMTVIVALFDLSSIQDSRGKTLTLLQCGDVSGVAPSYESPVLDLQAMNLLIPVAFAIALIGMLEANSIGKSIAVSTGQRLNKNQEVFALGCANFFLCFFQAIPCSGSASRTVVNVQHGAQTRFAAMGSGVIVGLVVFFLGSVIQYVPRASLAALLVATAFRMVDYSQLKLCIRSTRSDGLVLLVTFFSCVFFSLPLAFYMGVALSIILFLRKAAMPRVAEYIFHEDTGELRPASEEERKLPHQIRFINVEGELFFGAVDLFQHTLRTIAEDDVTTKVIVLRLKHVHDLDATTALALQQLKMYLDKSHRHLIVCSIPPHVVELLEKSHLSQVLGPKNMIPCDHSAPQVVLKKAVERAKDLLLE